MNQSIEPESTSERSQQKPFTDHSEWFNTLLKHYNGKKLGVEVTPPQIQENFVSLWSKLKDPAKPVDILFIGAGNGIFEIPFIAKLAEMRGSQDNLSVYSMDPSQELHKQFIQNAQRHGVAQTIKKYDENTFEDSAYNPPQADLAIASHCWYYVPDGEGNDEKTNPLVKFYKSIKPGGAGLIALQSRESDNFKFRREFTPKVHGQTVQEKSGEDVEAQLSKLGINHIGINVVAETDMSEIFTNGLEFKPTDEGKMILSFMIREDWNKLSPDLQTEIKEHLTRTVRKNREETGKNVMFFRERYTWIPGKE